MSARAPVPDPVALARRQRLFDLFRGRGLTPAQRQIARCLVAHSDEAQFLTASELAGLAHVSQASVTRFAVVLGFQGYPELRAALRQVAPAADAAATEQLSMNAWQRSLTFEIGVLEETRRWLADEQPVRDAAAVLARSRPLSVLGLRSAGPLAQYFSYFAAKVLPDVRALSSVGTVAMSDALEHARAAGAEALLAFVLPRYPRESLELLGIARDLGYRIVCITDAPGSPAEEHAELVLYAPVDSSLVFDSHAVPVTLAMVLLDAICTVEETLTQARLDRFDRFATEVDLFVRIPNETRKEVR